MRWYIYDENVITLLYLDSPYTHDNKVDIVIIQKP